MITVTMRDKFMSGWGRAKGLTSIFMVHCDDHKQADQIAAIAEKRGEMTHVNIRDTDKKPYYAPSRYQVSERNFSDLGWTL